MQMQVQMHENGDSITPGYSRSIRWQERRTHHCCRVSFSAHRSACQTIQPWDRHQRRSKPGLRAGQKRPPWFGVGGCECVCGCRLWLGGRSRGKASSRSVVREGLTDARRRGGPVHGFDWIWATDFLVSPKSVEEDTDGKKDVGGEEEKRRRKETVSGGDGSGRSEGLAGLRRMHVERSPGQVERSGRRWNCEMEREK